MQRYWFIVALALALTAGEPALACRTEQTIALEDVRKANVVLVGRISNYRIISVSYARFVIQVDEVLVGRVPQRLSIHWNNSTFEVPIDLRSGPFLIALQGPSTNSDYELGSFKLLQAHCSDPFLFDSTSDEAVAVRRILTTPRS